MKLIQASERHMECAYYLVLDPCACGTSVTNLGGRRQSSPNNYAVRRPCARMFGPVMDLIEYPW